MINKECLMVRMDEETIKRVYKQLTSSWNERNAQGMASLFTESGESIGFDGSLSKGPEEIATHLAPIFRDHPTCLWQSINVGFGIFFMPCPAGQGIKKMPLANLPK